MWKGLNLCIDFLTFCQDLKLQGALTDRKKTDCGQKMQIIPLDHKKDLMNYHMYQREGYSLLVELLILDNSFIRYYSTL